MVFGSQRSALVRVITRSRNQCREFPTEVAWSPLAGQADFSEYLHVYEEWADDRCNSSRCAADLVQGTTWSWNRVRLSESKVLQRQDQKWSDGEAVKLELEVLSEQVRPYVMPRDGVFVDKVTDEPRKRTRYEGQRYVVEHRFDRTSCTGDCGATQIVQVFYATPSRMGQIGRIKYGYDRAVDAGWHSPWVLANGYTPGHPTMPYFYQPRRYRTEAASTGMAYFDEPKSIDRHEEAFLEAGFLCINHLGRGRDTFLQALCFGWAKYGGLSKPYPDATAGIGEKVMPTVSEMFKDVVLNDYPSYSPSW